MNVTDDGRPRLFLVVLVVLAAVTSGGFAWAEPTAADRAAAETLFREARGLMKKKQYEEACPLFEESQRLDYQGGTLLNLAICHEKQGKLASAWVEYQEALVVAREAKRNERVRIAKKAIKRLEGKVPHLTIEVDEAATVEGLTILRDGEEIGSAGWGKGLPLDPGTHTIEASAPNRKPWSMEVTVEPGETTSVQVPVLEKKPKPKPKAKPKPKTKPKPEPSSDWKRPAGFVIGGVGLVALGVGAVFGARAISKNNQSEDHCNGELCDAEGVDLNDTAKRSANISNIGIGLGVVGIGVGTYLLLTADSSDTPEGIQAEVAKRHRGIEWTPTAGPEGAAILMRGAW